MLCFELFCCKFNIMTNQTENPEKSGLFGLSRTGKTALSAPFVGPEKNTNLLEKTLDLKIFKNLNVQLFK